MGWNKGTAVEEELECSIIIPNYNYSAYLAGAIQSCLDLNHLPSEIIVVDDASTDHSQDIIERYVKKHPSLVKSILLKENSGSREVPLNLGLRSARGKYIVALDADDSLMPDYLDNVLPKFTNEKIGVVRIANNRFGVENYFQPPRAWVSDDRVKDMLEANHVLSTSSFRRKVWQSLSGFDESGPIRAALGDWDFWIRTAIVGWEFADAIDVPSVNYRIHVQSGSYTRNFNIPLKYLKLKYADLIRQKGIVIGPLSKHWKI